MIAESIMTLKYELKRGRKPYCIYTGIYIFQGEDIVLEPLNPRIGAIIVDELNSCSSCSEQRGLLMYYGGHANQRNIDRDNNSPALYMQSVGRGLRSPIIYNHYDMLDSMKYALSEKIDLFKIQELQVLKTHKTVYAWNDDLKTMTILVQRKLSNQQNNIDMDDKKLSLAIKLSQKISDLKKHIEFLKKGESVHVKVQYAYENRTAFEECTDHKVILKSVINSHERELKKIEKEYAAL